ncbi:MAG TPA: DUF1501 domain-containing protein [Tepidisphaeraceae bacterium]|jgi:uncharacterized protein (DUF1501 family)
MRRPTDREKELTRRDLFRRAACAAVSSVAIASQVRDLRLINAAVADAIGPATDYKALVCIFLFGGNDANNFLVQTDTDPNPTPSYGYNAYAAARKDLSLPLASLLPLIGGAPMADGHTYGLHPSCTELASLFNAQNSNLALLCNVGTLLFPITRAQYVARSVAVPPQLFSHNDQVIQWQTSIPDRDSRTGWCGRVADLVYSMNGSSKVSMSIALSGVNTLEVGNIVSEYNVSSSGPVGLSNINSPGTEAYNLNQKLQDLNNTALTPASPTTPQENLYEVGYATVTKRAIDNFAAMSGAIAPTVDPTGGSYWTTAFPNTSLGRQLKMAARIIAGRKNLGHARQIFFVSVGGYDLHTTQYGTAAAPDDTTVGAHANLLRELSQCIGAFTAAIAQLRTSGDANIALGASDSVVGFTASDFSRTFPVNGGKGSDHGWGNHHIVFGDGVQGGRLYGTFPTYLVGGPDDTQLGRWIPKTSVDEYSATLAKWFGVPATSLSAIFPNLPRFGDYTSNDLGFFTPPVQAPTPSGGVSAPVVLAPVSKPKPKPAPVKRPAARKSG